MQNKYLQIHMAHATPKSRRPTLARASYPWLTANKVLVAVTLAILLGFWLGFKYAQILSEVY